MSGSKRHRNLNDLLRGELAAPQESQPPPTPAVSAVSVPVEVSVPRYQTLTRKEVRFRDDQLERLEKLVRQLARTRRTTGSESTERLTENTLVRVAVDFLLEHANDLRGTSEQELLQALQHKFRPQRPH